MITYCFNLRGISGKKLNSIKLTEKNIVEIWNASLILKSIGLMSSYNETQERIKIEIINTTGLGTFKSIKFFKFSSR